MEIMPDENQWVLLTEVGQMSEAAIVCSKLESAGIKTFVKNQNMNTLLGLGISGFSIEIYVLLSDLEKAADVVFS
ncbi:alcohol dehydrogenase [Schleiferia thermophila str. Yellowstone]|nr:alcohol dehydrogenase [Schleiferia thermophila str. Yellowstone]